MRVKAFPELVNGRSCGLRTNVEQDTNIGLDEWAKGIEEPSMAVQLLLVLLLEAENDLDWTSTGRNFTRVTDDNLGSVFEYMSGHILSGDGVLGDTLLIATHQIENFEGALIDL